MTSHPIPDSYEIDRSSGEEEAQGDNGSVIRNVLLGQFKYYNIMSGVSSTIARTMYIVILLFYLVVEYNAPSDFMWRANTYSLFLLATLSAMWLIEHRFLTIASNKIQDMILQYEMGFGDKQEKPWSSLYIEARYDLQTSGWLHFLNRLREFEPILWFIVAIILLRFL